MRAAILKTFQPLQLCENTTRGRLDQARRELIQSQRGGQEVEGGGQERSWSNIGGRDGKLGKQEAPEGRGSGRSGDGP